MGRRGREVKQGEADGQAQSRAIQPQPQEPPSTWQNLMLPQGEGEPHASSTTRIDPLTLPRVADGVPKLLHVLVVGDVLHR